MKKKRWPTQFSAYPYARPLINSWLQDDHIQDQYWPEYEQAIENYLVAQDENFSLGDRYNFLLKSKEQFQALAKKGDKHIGTSLALVRISFELEDFVSAQKAIDDMLIIMPWLTETLPETLKIHINRPFLAPMADFDEKIVFGSLVNWLQSAVNYSLAFLSKNQNQ